MSFAEVSAGVSKVDHFAAVYGRMHAGIEPHATHLDASNLYILDGIDFVFLTVDGTEARRVIAPALEALGIPFVDAGLGLTLVDDAIMGMVRVTTSTPSMRVAGRTRLPTVEGDGELYRSNIQVADMNAFAAALAVMRWKRLAGFYVDLEGEYNSLFSVDGNHILNSDHRPQGAPIATSTRV